MCLRYHANRFNIVEHPIDLKKTLILNRIQNFRLIPQNINFSTNVQF